MMVKLVIKKFGIVIIWLLFGSANGQEEQVEFLPGVFELTDAQRIKAEVLNEYSDGFTKALLFKNSNDYLLRIEFKKRGSQWKDDVFISVTELEVLREKLQDSLLNSSPELSEVSNPYGRGYLIISTSLHAIAQSRVLSNLFYDVIQPNPFITFTYRERTRFGQAFPYFVSVGSIASSILFTRNKLIPPAATKMHFWGSIMGYGHGILLSSMIREPYRQSDNVYLENILISGTSLIEGWLGYHIAKRNNFSITRTKAIISGNVWGGASGLAVYGMLKKDDEFSYSTAGFSGLIGSGIGLFTADMLLHKYPRTTGDITAINMAGAVGMSWSTSVAYSFDLEGREAFYCYFFGALGGLSLAGLSTNRTKFSDLEGGLVAVSTFAGGALGFGVAYLLYLGDAGYTLSTALGLTAGWFIAYKLLSTNKIRSNLLGFGGKIKWHINPANVGLIMSSPERQASLMRQNIRMDLVGLKLTF